MDTVRRSPLGAVILLAPWHDSTRGRSGRILAVALVRDSTRPSARDPCMERRRFKFLLRMHTPESLGLPDVHDKLSGGCHNADRTLLR